MSTVPRTRSEDTQCRRLQQRDVDRTTNPKIMPVTWWVAPSRGFQDGYIGYNGRVCNTLSEFKFNGDHPPNWYSDKELNEWTGIKMEDGFLKIRVPDIRLFSMRRHEILTYLPDSIGELKQLTELSILLGQITVLPVVIGQLTSLTKLIIQSNQLTELPDLSALVSLTFLNISGNRLTSLPDLSKMVSMMELYVSSNRLTELQDLSTMTSLKQLLVGNNRLTSLPALHTATSLKTLCVNDNQLVSIPELPLSLTRLHVEHNQLTTLPLSNEFLMSLTYLKYDNNPFTPDEVERLQQIGERGY